MKTLYPEIEPYQSFFLATGSVHSVYVEISGNADGVPVIFLHGGPCSGTRPDHRRFFDPKKYRIILFDQRGCGQSLPFGELADNTTQDLIDDMEGIRQQLQIERWQLFGGSWGGALALLYAQQFPHRVSAMVIRGVFLARQQDMDWFAKFGANQLYPECWRQVLDAIAEQDWGDVVSGFCNALWGSDELARIRAAKAWEAWGAQVALGKDYQPGANDEPARVQSWVLQARMELHYARNRYFIAENQILNRCAMITDIPTVIIHGRNDWVCPIAAAYQLQQQLPQAQFWPLAEAGHIAGGAQMIDALVRATDTMAENNH